MLDVKFIEERKKELLNQKKELEKELSKIASHEKGDYKPKFPSFGNEPEENELEVSEYDENIDAEKKLDKMLHETNEALGRIKEGNYGVCENCKQEIDQARLKAYPAAITCFRCEDNT